MNASAHPSLVTTPADAETRARETSGMRHVNGTLDGDRYRIVEVLGVGGMSEVYGAIDCALERPVAIKVVHLTTKVSLEQVAREARVLASIRHPNVVTVHALRAEGAPAFLVMERLPGGTLEQKLAQDRPSLKETLDIAEQIAAGLDAIHAAGLVHGDVKPSNVLFDHDGRVKLADFGLVPILERMRPGEVLGTPAYIPPERARGAMPAPGHAHQSDVYSFGCLLFEMLTGRPVFQATWADELVKAHADQAPPRVSAVSSLARCFDLPIARALAKTPGRRPETARALVAQVRRATMGTDAHGKALRVLVVDDDPDIRALFRTALPALLPGAIIESASDGAGALASVAHTAPSVVLLDLSLPGLSGVELVRAMCAAAPRAAVFVVTGHGSGPEWREARALGAARFFVKPVSTTEIVRAIRAHVEAPDGGLSVSAPR